MTEEEGGDGARYDLGTRAKFDEILLRLMAIDGVVGVSLIDRAGSPILSRGAANTASELLMPIVATLAGAGHIAVEELEPDPDVRVTAKSDKTRIHVAGVDEEHLLVTVADSRKPWEGIRSTVNHARKALREAIGRRSGAP